MEIEPLVKKMKDIYAVLIDFIENADDFDAKYKELINVIEKQEILQNKENIRLLIQLASKIADNHHRSSDFFNKLEKFIHYTFKGETLPISDLKSDNFKYNKRIFIFLLQNNLIKVDQSYIKSYLQERPFSATFSKSNIEKFQSFYYLYSGIKENLESEVQKEIEQEILQLFCDDFSIFFKKCQTGENDSNICRLIRDDSVEEFIKYINRNSISPTSKIKVSLYETNLYLIGKEPTLIEYASFFGSIQIIQYLKYNIASLSDSMWIYGIHSNNPEIIRFLEYEEVELNKKSENSKESNEICEDDVIIESIKCHHNNISNYFKDKLQYNQNYFKCYFGFYIGDSLNFCFFPNNDFESLIYKPRNQNSFRLNQLIFSLKIITIPSSVKSIGNKSFEGCSSLTQITIPSSVKSIGNNAFKGCSSLTQISIPSSVTAIGNNAFKGCSSLTQISIPSSVYEIKDNVFKGCSSLTQILIPSSVKSIGNKSFKECSSLTQITIPSSVKSIGNNAFKGCSSLTQIKILSLLTKIQDNTFKRCSSLTQIIIPTSVKSIGNNAFKGCSSLEQISIPSSVKSIGYNAFEGCSSLEQISIPSSVHEIQNRTFFGCSSLTKITIPSSVAKIGVSAFSGCSSLTQITIPSSVTEIQKNCFSRCSSLKQITIPSSIKKIDIGCFYECTSLTQITIPSSVCEILNGAFSGCSSLTQIKIPSSVKSINKSTKYKDIYRKEGYFIDDLKDIIPQDNTTVYVADLPVDNESNPPCCTVDEILLRQFFKDYDVSLSQDSVIIKTKMRADGTLCAFAYVKFGTRDEALRAVSELNYKKINDFPVRLISLEEKDKSVLNDKKSSIAIMNIDKSIEESQIHEAFENFGKVITCKIPFNIVTENYEKKVVSHEYGFVLFRYQKDAIQAMKDLLDASINGRPFTLEQILNDVCASGIKGAFEGCSSLEQISISSSVKEIGDKTFKGCKSLKQIQIPSSVTKIGNNAFEGCSSLTQISIPSSVTEIGNNAFEGCSSLTQISIPSSLKIEEIGLNSKVQVLQI